MTDSGISYKFETSLTPKDFLENLAHAGKAADMSLKKYFAALGKVAEDAAVAKVKPHRYKGELEKSLKHGATSTSKGLTFGTNVSYAAMQDDPKRWGVKAGWPNVVALRAWTMKTKAAHTSGANIESLTYLFGRAISIHGIKHPIHFMLAAENAVIHHAPAEQGKIAAEIVRYLSK